MRHMEWIIKPSTFCNLRCRYCYEWHGLDDPSRMPLGRWRRIADAIARYHLLLEARSGEEVRTRVIWHGGEPPALPVD